MTHRCFVRHFVSYPKSGRTWVRYILVLLDCANSVNFHHDNFEFNNANMPLLDFNVSRRLFAYSNVDRLVYLERDPRDIIVSLFHQVTGRFQDFFGYEGTVSEFIRHDYFGVSNLRQFRLMWNEIASSRDVLVVSYEALHNNRFVIVRTIVDYYGWDMSDNQLRDAIQNAEFDRMKTVEKSGTFPEPWLNPRNGFPKVRKGKVGGFREELGAEDIRYLNEVFELSD